MNARFIDWIWHVRGTLALAPGQSSDDAFGRLAPLFGQRGTSHDRSGDHLTFHKKDQDAQDKMAVFDGGSLQISKTASGPVLHYHLKSRTLLFCFLLPLLFLAFGQMTIGLGKWEAARAHAAGKPADAAKKPEKKTVERPQNPVDRFLGAPAPEKPKKDGADKDKADKKHSPTSAYVFAAIFAVLYVFGRIFEDRQVKALFSKSLEGTGGLLPAR